VKDESLVRVALVVAVIEFETVGEMDKLGESVGDDDQDVDMEAVVVMEGEMEIEGEGEGVGAAAHHNAYIFPSSDPPYTVPSTPIAGDAPTWLPVGKVHSSAPLLPFHAYTIKSLEPTYTVPSALTAGDE
jgi:hypothetical protein